MPSEKFTYDISSSGNAAFKFAGQQVFRDDARPAITPVSMSLSMRFKDPSALPHDKGVYNFGNFGSQSGSNGFLDQMATGSVGSLPAAPEQVLKFKAKRTTGSASVESLGQTQSREWVHVHGVCTASFIKLWIEGQDKSGTTTFTAGGTIDLPSLSLTLGSGPRDASTGAFSGLIDFVRWYPGEFSQSYITTEVENRKYPDETVGFGDFDAPGDTELSAVAVPITAGPVLFPNHVDIDLKAAGFVPNAATCTLNFDPAQFGVVTKVSDKLRYAPNNGVNNTEDTFRGHLDVPGKRSSAIIRVRIGTPALLRDHPWPLPASVAQHYIANPDKIKMWANYPIAAMPSHNVGDLLVPYNDGSPITISNKAFQPKGNVILSGLVFNPVGVANGDTSAATKGISYTQRWMADTSAVSPVTWEHESGDPRNWNILYFCNCFIDPSVAGNTAGAGFGDFLRAGHNGKLPNDPVTHALRGKKMALFLNQVRMENGFHYVSDMKLPLPTGYASSENGHADYVQSFGGLPVIRAGNVHSEYAGMQGFYSGREAGDLGFPRTTRWRFKNFVMKHIPSWWNPNTAFTHGTNVHPLCVDITEGQAGPNGENYSYSEGKYLACEFDNCHYLGQKAANSSNWAGYIRFGLADNAGLSITSGYGLDTNRYYKFKTGVQGDHTFPAFAGSFRYHGPANSADVPEVCPKTATGSDYQLRSVADVLSFLSIFA